MRHFLRDDDLTAAEQTEVLDRAVRMKADPGGERCLEGNVAALVFDKPSTRTRVSFSVGVWQLGGFPLILEGQTSQLGRGEPVADTTWVLDRQAGLIVWRTFSQRAIEEMAAVSRVPVINALTDEFHPCQILADLLTIRERLGRTAGLTVAYLGDCANNMAHSYLLGGAVAGMHVRVAGPPSHQPAPQVLADAERAAQRCGGSVQAGTDPVAAATGAHVVVTDTWVSMGMEDSKTSRIGADNPFLPFQVDEAMMDRADPQAVFLHCLPAYRGLEVTAEVLEGPRSAVWDEAENRLHAQKALITFLMERR